MHIEDYPNTTAVVQALQEKKVTADQLAGTVKLPSLSSCLNTMMGRRGLSVEVTAGMADINRATLHKIMTQKVNPSRNVLLRLALALEMSFDETQTLLKSGSCTALSGRRERDLFIIEGITNRRTFDEVNDNLNRYGFPDLYSKG